MKILNRSKQSTKLAWSVCPLPQFRDQALHPLSLHLCVKGTFDLVPGGRAVAVQARPEVPAGDTPIPGGENLGLGYSSDYVAIKPFGEFLVQGSAYPPKGFTGRGFTAGCRVGDVRKEVLVHGERAWKRSILGIEPSLAGAITPIPLSYAYSYGGPGAELNPIGKGYDGVEIHRIESPKKPILAKGITVQPVGFGPLPRDWPQRNVYFGTCGADHLETRWPWWPEGFDWRYFQSAPHDQWTKGYWRGDESMQFENLHPEISDYRCELPGLRVRCFARRQPIFDGGSGRCEPEAPIFFEVEMVLDTIWVNPESGRLILCWRGHIPVATIKSPDLQSLWVGLEPLGEDPDLALRARAELIALATLPAIKAPPKPPEAADPDPLADAAVESNRAEALRMRVEEAVAKARANRPADPRTVAEVNSMREQLRSLEAQLMAAAKNPAMKRAWEAIANGPEDRRSAAEVKKMMEQVRLLEARLKATAASAGKIQESDMAAQSVPDEVLPDDQAASTEAAKIRRAELEKQFADLEASAPVPPKWQNFERDGRMDIDAMRKDGMVDADCRKAPFAGLDLSGINFGGAVFTGSDLTGTKFCRSNLTGVDFTGCRLIETDFSGAMLASARFSENVFGGTRFERALCRDVKFLEADLRGAVLTGFQAPRASFEKCNLSGVDLAGALLTMAEFPESDVSGANFEGAILSGADFRNCNASGSELSGCHLENLRADERTQFSGAKFVRALAKGAIFEGCNLQGADFSKADLQRVRLVEVMAAGACFNKVDLRKATCEDSSFEGATFEDVNAASAVFDRSNCRAARFHRSNLYNASFWETNLLEARWDHAFIARTRLAVRNG